MNFKIQPERHHTSLFSEYQNNSNNSISSKQLEIWLQQMAHTSHTSLKFPQQWNLLSTSSRYQSDGMTFGPRLNTFESANKENIQSQANFTNESTKLKQNHFQSLKQPDQKLKYSKSYLNAMQELQKRAKTLQQQNLTMRKSILILQSQKRNSLHSSMIQSEQMKHKIFKFEETEKRVEQIKKENKKLRDSKNQQSLKIKLMERSFNEQKAKIQTFNQKLEALSQENLKIKQQSNEANDMVKSLISENKKLAMMTNTLENMKQKSTNSILEKYSKALEKIQQLELAIDELKNKAASFESKHQKAIMEKDAKIFSLFESMNQIKLQKEQIQIRFQQLYSQQEEKSRKLSELQKNLNLIQQGCSEQSIKFANLKQAFTLKTKKFDKLSRNNAKLQKKYSDLLAKLQKNSPIIKKPANQNQSECSSNSSLQAQNLSESLMKQKQQKKNRRSDEIIEQKMYQKSLETPVEKYDEESLTDDFNLYVEQFSLAKPYSITMNAKRSQVEVKSEKNDQRQTEDQNKNNDIDQKHPKMAISQNRKQSEAEQVVIKRASRKKSKFIESVLKQMSKNLQQKISSKQQSSDKSQDCQRKSVDKSKSLNKKQLQESKYINPSRFHQKKKSSNSKSVSSSRHKSKSSSIQKKKSEWKNSISVNSKRKFSLDQKQMLQNSIQRCNHKKIQVQPLQNQSSQGRHSQSHVYQSGSLNDQFNQQSHGPYYFKDFLNRRNCKQDQSLQCLFNQQQTQPQRSISQENAKKCLNKVLLLEYQEEALKLYEEHENLLQKSSNESLSPAQRAEIIGRIKQVMQMIDYNTEKILSIKENSE